MVTEKLIFENQYEVALTDSLRPALTMSINDLKDPSKRKSDYSKTITLPSSKLLDKIFNNIFEVNVETLTFNPNKKTAITYIADSEIQLQGYLKLNEVTINNLNKVNYQVSIIGTVGDLFNNIGENLLTDLDFTEYNHDRSGTIIENSWDTSIEENGISVPFIYGKGYVYPMIDYGFNSNLQEYYVTELMPAIYLKEYVDKIFEDAGKTYTSSFFSSAFFKRLIVPFNGVEINKTTAQIELDLFKADGATATLTTSHQTIIFPNEVSDPNGVYNNATGEYTVNEGGWFDITSILDFEAHFTPTGNVVDVYVNRPIKVELIILVNGVLKGASFMYIGDTTVAIPPTTTYDTGLNVAFPSAAYGTAYSGTSLIDNKLTDPASNLPVRAVQVPLISGDVVKVMARAINGPLLNGGYDLFIDGSGVAYSGTITVDVGSGKFLNSVTKASVIETGIIDMSGVIPQKIKQKDLLTSVINLFGLEIEADKTDPNNYIIEPYKDFYTTNTVDWQHKIDNHSDIVFEPMALLEASEYLYTYKEDKDYYNKSYKDGLGEVYGQRSGLIDNDFVKALTKTEVIFSPTPIVGQNYIDMVVPTIIKDDINSYQTTAHNIRLLYYNGLKSTVTAWEMKSTFGTSTFYTSYPYAGHFDDPFNPTLDINFGIVRKLFYDSTFHDITITNNGLFNKYHLPRLQQISNRDSKLVSGMFYLKPKDIANLSFRNLYFFKNSYFRLYKIENYDPNKRLTKCYFLKVINVNPFVENNYTVVGGSGTTGLPFVGGVSMGEDLPLLDYAEPRNGNTSITSSGTIEGQDNRVDYSARNIFVSGSNNSIGSYVENVKILQGDGNQVLANNVTLINCSNQTVTTDNTVMINNVIVSGDGVVESKDVSFSALPSVMTYECDTSSATILVELDYELDYEGKIYNFKKMSASNTLTLSPAHGRLIDGSATYSFTTNLQTVSVQYNGQNYIIISHG